MKKKLAIKYTCVKCELEVGEVYLRFLKATGVHFESALFNIADNLCDEYTGGSWEAFILSAKSLTHATETKGFFMVPKSLPDKIMATSLGFMRDVPLTRQAFGIGITMMALSNYSMYLMQYADKSPSHEAAGYRAAEYFHMLREYVMDSSDFSEEDRESLLALID